MAARPEVFISATTLDLKSARQLLRDALLTLGCVPIVQDHFAPDARTAREMLRARIGTCDAVLHLAGECYGTEPRERDASQPRRSYTQLEHDMAIELKKPLYTFICDGSYPYDDHEPEPEELVALQQKHRADLKAGDHLYHEIHDSHELELRTRELPAQLEQVTAELHKTRSWLGRGVAVGLAALLLVGAVLYRLHNRTADIREQNISLQQESQAQQQQLAALQAQLQQQTQLITLVSEKIDRSAAAPAGPGKSDPAASAQVEAARQLGITVDELRKQLVSEKADVHQILAEIDQGGAAAETQAGNWRTLKRQALTKLGDAEYAAGHYADAIEPYQNALALIAEEKEPRDWCELAQKLELAIWRQGRFAEAEPLARKLVEKRTALQGAEHPDTLKAIHYLGSLLFTKGDYVSSEPLLRDVWERRARTLGKDHPDTLASLANLADLLVAKGDLAAAEPLARNAIEARERVLGKDHADTMASINNLGRLLFQKGDLVGAEALFRRAADGYETLLGREHPTAIAMINNLAAIAYARGDYAAAEPLYRRNLEVQERTLGPEHPDTLFTISNLAILLYLKGDYVGSEPLSRRALDVRQRTLGRDNPETLVSTSNLAQLLAAKGDLKGAEPLYVEALEGEERILGKQHQYTQDTAYNFSLMRQKQGRLKEALALAEETVDGARRGLPEASPERKAYELNLETLKKRMAAEEQK